MSVTLTLPITAISMPKKITPKNKKLLFSVAILLVIVTIVGVSLLSQQRKNRSADMAQSPQYATILPSGKTIQQLGGWSRVSPQNSTPVYSYADTLESIVISVSQQPLPETFKSEPELQTSKLAESYSATTKFDASGTTIYLGTSASGPQSVIFTKNRLLVLIKSQNKISENAWKSYVQALK